LVSDRAKPKHRHAVTAMVTASDIGAAAEGPWLRLMNGLTKAPTVKKHSTTVPIRAIARAVPPKTMTNL
jgi:hypothetical protein